MRPILIDTNAYAAFMRADANVAEVFSRAEALRMNTIVIGELLGGFAAGTREEKNRAQLTQFLDSPRVRVYDMTMATADCYSLIYAGLRRKGVPIPSNDLWIAASALEHSAGLLTLDAHFLHIDGLRCGSRYEQFLP